MIDVGQIGEQLTEHGMPSWASIVEQQLAERLTNRPHGDLPRWRDALEQLPSVDATFVDLNRGLLTIGARQDTTIEQRAAIEQGLRRFMPWRKGPYQIHGVFIDTEWRSDWKWDRIAPHLAPLPGRAVLDIGCGSGYHLWRMLGAGASFVLGVDPSSLFLTQFSAVRHFIRHSPSGEALTRRVHMLPVGIEHVPADLAAFDTVFSMGVLYHRRAPIDHLQELRSVLRDGGELVLETLIVDGDETTILLPQDRYAKMRNVWFIPSVAALERMLLRAGFRAIRTVDVSSTSIDEQRATDWMTFESLADFLDPADNGLTVEGYPAPRRAVVIASK